MTTPLKLLAGLVGVALMAGGCAETHQVKGDDIKTGFLTHSYPLLKPGKEGQANLVYIAPNVNWKSYDKIMLDAVSVWLGRGDAVAQDTGVVPPDDVRRLANTFYKKLADELSKDYTLVQSSGKGVMRLSVALTDIEHGMPVLDTVSTIVPMARVASEGKNLASGTHAFVGHANVEARLVDSRSGKLLGAGIDQRAGAKTFGKGIGFWSDVENAFDHWAAKIRYRLCLKRGDKNCEKPKDLDS